MALSFWPLAVGSWLVLLHPVGTLGNVESEGRTLCERLQHRSINGDGRPPARYSRASLQDSVTASVESEGVPRPRRPVGTHDLCVRPRQSETSSRSFDNGRTDRASLQDSVTASIKSEGRTLCERLQHRDLTTTDAQIVRPYRIQSRLVSSHSASLALHPHVVLFSSSSSPPRPVESSNTSQRPTAKS